MPSERSGVRQAPRIEGEDNGEWIIIDCGQAVAHVMQPVIRQYYRLEEIWGRQARAPEVGGREGDRSPRGRGRQARDEGPPARARSSKSNRWMPSRWHASRPRPAAAAAPVPAKAPAKKGRRQNRRQTRGEDRRQASRQGQPVPQAPAKKESARKRPNPAPPCRLWWSTSRSRPSGPQAAKKAAPKKKA